MSHQVCYMAVVSFFFLFLLQQLLQDWVCYDSQRQFQVCAFRQSLPYAENLWNQEKGISIWKQYQQNNYLV